MGNNIPEKMGNIKPELTATLKDRRLNEIDLQNGY